MKKYKIFAMNPGSTSTKIALFENETKVFQKNVAHSREELAKFGHVRDQFEYRYQTILDSLAEENISLEGTDCFVARCGGVYPCEGGIYNVDDLVIEHCFSGYIVHPAMLGGKLARMFSEKYGGKALFLNPPDTDELQDVARVTGFKEIYRTSNVHMLNQKETAIRAAKEMDKKYEDCRFIVCHIGGGVSVSAHLYGKVVDSSSIVNGEGPFTPTRAGALPLVPFMDLCYSGKWTRDEMYDRMIQGGGFIDLVGTNDVPTIVQMAKDGDEYADLVLRTFVYQIGKYIGEMAAVLHQDVDAILIGGGIAHNASIIEGLKAMCGKIAEFRVYPGEFEMEALAAGALRALTGEEEVKTYTGIPTFQGFDHLKRIK